MNDWRRVIGGGAHARVAPAVPDLPTIAPDSARSAVVPADDGAAAVARARPRAGRALGYHPGTHALEPDDRPAAARRARGPLRGGAEARSLAAGLTIALGACGASEVTLVMPEGVATMVVVSGRDAWLLARDQPSPMLRFEDRGDVAMALYFDAPPAALLLETDDRGTLVRATDPDPAASWPLPPPSGGARYDGASFVPIEDPQALEAARVEIRVPVAPCGRLVLDESVRTRFDLGRTGATGVAAVGRSALVTTHGILLPPRALLVDGEAELDLALPVAPAIGDSLHAHADGDAFFLAHFGAGRARTYRVSTRGEITPVHDVASAVPAGLDATVHWPGTTVLYGRDSATRTLARFDGTGPWTPVHTAAGPPDDQRCIPYALEQALALEGPDRGVLSFIGHGPARFSADGATPIVSELVLGKPCASSYVRLGDVELVLQLAGLRGDGTLDVQGAWRRGPIEPWIEGSDVGTTLVDAAPAEGPRAVAIDSYLDDVVLLSHDPRRADQPPRACARLGTGDVRQLTFDGRAGTAVAQQDMNKPLYVLRFSVEAP